MSYFINISTPVQTYQDKEKARFSYTISRLHGSYFGLCDSRSLLIKRVNSSGQQYNYKYWGFPEKSKWKSSWGSPDWRLQNETTVIANGCTGYLRESVYLEDEVKINRGNSRQGSMRVTVGVYAGSGNESRFGTTEQSITLYTSKVADPSNSWLSVTADGAEVANRKITVKGGFTNPEGYYTMKLYRNGTNVSFNGEYTESITKDKEKTTIYYELRVYGKDGTCYTAMTKTGSVTPAESSKGIRVNQKGIKKVYELKRKNVTLKDVKDIYIKKDGKIRKVIN